ncbi:M15 family metallopeptidase [Alkalihalobacillus oceani]|uniref:M15 family metallopeptidase n=1 Tax=Halalkalibacter oceani TaxID=1653776 RepID=UPI00203F194A|nr:M15 family metallopeptidase [Halalkalibacter oceani]MCM3759224.1 M15 family metallopeptidase [Halalkalibacter oceani]
MKKPLIVIIGIISLFVGQACDQQQSTTDQDSPMLSSHTEQAEGNEAGEASAGPDSEQNEEPGIEVVTDPQSVAVLVNEEYALMDGYEPDDLVYPDIPFIFEEKVEKRLMRQEAADAVEQLFAAAKDDGMTLLGVSAYRSYQTQKSLFDYYVAQDGEELARTYSAVPGTSEHQTGLAIDVVGEDLSCAVEDCFADTVEAKWLEENAADYGFIIRYMEGKEELTGFKYEPWHLRYVGVEMAQEITKLGVTLEEYMNAVPVSDQTPIEN